MKGHIRQRSKGSWKITIDIGADPSTGRRRGLFYQRCWLIATLCFVSRTAAHWIQAP